jgi:hypothetical protein
MYSPIPMDYCCRVRVGVGKLSWGSQLDLGWIADFVRWHFLRPLICAPVCKAVNLSQSDALYSAKVRTSVIAIVSNKKAQVTLL